MPTGAKSRGSVWATLRKPSCAVTRYQRTNAPTRMRNSPRREAGAGSNQNPRTLSTILFVLMILLFHFAAAVNLLGHGLLLPVKKVVHHKLARDDRDGHDPRPGFIVLPRQFLCD